MRIAFLMKHREDYARRIPAGLDWIELSTGADGSYSPDALARMEEVDGVITSHEPVHDQLLAAAPKLKIIQRSGVGYDNVDIKAAARRGIPVCNLAEVNKHAVAEHGMALMLGLSRRLAENHNLTVAGDWHGARELLEDTCELQGKRLGILGFGKAGFELARRARAFGMEILFHARSPVDPGQVQEVGGMAREQEALFRESDFLCVLVSLNDSTRNLVDAGRLAMMQPTARLINLARGGIVDEQALADALNEGRLAGAGVDVFSQEPITPENPLLAARNVVLSCHAAGTTRECTDREIAWAVDNVRGYIERGEAPRWIVNGVKV